MTQWFTQPVQPRAQQFLLIDVLRGLAASTIVVFHYKNFFRGSTLQEIDLSALDQIPFFQGLSFLRYNGASAVMLFWMISGFVLVLVYGGQGRNIDRRGYIVNRFSRLYPLHFLTLIYILMLQILSIQWFGQGQIYQNTDAYHFVLQVFFVSAFGFEQGLSFNGPIWSVSAEIFTYAMFLVFVMFVPVSIVWVTLAFLVSMLVFALSGSVLSLCLVYFVAGMLIFLFFHIVQSRPRLSIIAVCVLVAIFLFIANWIEKMGVSLPETIWFIAVFGGLIMCTALLEVAFPFRNVYRRFRFVGDVTYASYLLHTPIQITFLVGVGLGLVPFNIVLSPVFAVTYFLFVFCLSYVVFLKVEMPAKRWVRNALTTRLKEAQESDRT